MFSGAPLRKRVPRSGFAIYGTPNATASAPLPARMALPFFLSNPVLTIRGTVRPSTARGFPPIHHIRRGVCLIRPAETGRADSHWRRAVRRHRSQRRGHCAWPARNPRQCRGFPRCRARVIADIQIRFGRPSAPMRSGEKRSLIWWLRQSISRFVWDPFPTQGWSWPNWGRYAVICAPRLPI